MRVLLGRLHSRTGEIIQSPLPFAKHSVSVTSCDGGDYHRQSSAPSLHHCSLGQPKPGRTLQPPTKGKLLKQQENRAPRPFWGKIPPSSVEETERACL